MSEKERNVFVRMGLLKKKHDWTTEDFQHYWRERHAELARRLPGLRGYVQNHVVDQMQRGITYRRGPEQLDGFSQLWFDDGEAMRAAIATDAGQALVADENHFIGDLRVVTVDQHEVIAPDADRPLIKRMSLLRRRPDVTPETFLREWRDVHAPLVRSIAGVRGYRQNLVVDRQVPKGTQVGYEQLPIDGIVELWFDSTEAIDAGFGSAQGRQTMTHALGFIGEITTFLVEPHVIV